MVTGFFVALIFEMVADSVSYGKSAFFPYVWLFYAPVKMMIDSTLRTDAR